MSPDVVLLARIQFGLTIMFHYLFPPLSIGLGVMLVFMEGMFLKTGDPIYEAMTKFWTRIFGLVFAMGVASGIVMEFQFGTNWSSYSRYVGDVFGAALAAEGIFAFFLESGFLAILLFGWDRVGPRMHFFSTVMVALGSIFSAIWIVVANSWMQTPAGYHLVQTPFGPRAETASFWAVVFNPSAPSRLIHTLIGAFILGAFFVMSITAYYIVKGRHLKLARRAFTIALVWGAIVSLAQLLTGDWSARVVVKYQPPKMAAMEGIFETKPYTPLSLFGIPDEKQGVVRAHVAIPGLLSLMTYFDPKQPVTGLDKVPRADWPPVQPTFQMYHLMIALGMFFIAITLLGLFLLWRGTLFEQRWLMWIFVFAVAGPFIANEAGWIVAEIGRQPWIVYGLMRTATAASPAVGSAEIMFSLIMFSAVYAMLFMLFIYVLDRKIRGGPEPVESGGVDPHHPPSEFFEAGGRRGKSQWHETDGSKEARHDD
ncbi:cytochrome ubiquinol oxidase subunit I [bacterium]|nr:cytochrome ubiquinol oxidase subunit I [bacterium]